MYHIIAYSHIDCNYIHIVDSRRCPKSEVFGTVLEYLFRDDIRRVTVLDLTKRRIDGYTPNTTTLGELVDAYC